MTLEDLLAENTAALKATGFNNKDPRVIQSDHMDNQKIQEIGFACARFTQ